MRDIILQHIKEQFGKTEPKEKRSNHYSYCSAPFEECVCRDLNEISYNTSLITGGYIDSFSMVVVLVFLEKTFDIKIPDKDATPKNFDTVDKIVELVKRFQ